jgi:FkbM family methyltransferase
MLKFPIAKYIPGSIRVFIRRAWRRIRPFTHRITLTDFVPEGCVFEVTTRPEEARVVNLGDEEEFLRLFLAEVRPGEVIYDVGSCVGLFALHAALLGGRVVAFEPDPSYRKRLLRNIEINRLKDSISVIEWAVSDRKGTEKLYTDGLEGNKSPGLRPVVDRGAVPVNTDTIDNAIGSGRLPLPELVKMDIEGAEILALRGMKQLLSSQNGPRCLFVELHPDFLPGFNSSVKECQSLIESSGYVSEHFKPRAGQLHHIYRKGIKANERS